MNMLELCDYIYTNYPLFKRQIPRWRLLSLLDKNEDKVVYTLENGKLVSAGFFVRITDTTLAKMKLGFVDIKNYTVIQELLQEKGNNIHFLFALGDGYKSIRKGIRKMIKRENPKSVSWYKQDMSKLNVFKGEVKLCHQSQQQS